MDGAGGFRKSRGNKLTAMMVVRNEEHRFLRQVLDDLSAYVDEIVILDDASTDSTPDICKSYEKVACFARNDEPMFQIHEGRLREKLWAMVEETEPDWILAVDADEMFEGRFKDEVRDLINQTDYDAVEFRLFDFWNSLTHYRVDGEWDPWPRFIRLLVRYFPGRTYTWPDLEFHSGRFPVEYRGDILTFHSDIRVKHFGWVNPSEHRAKYEFYRAKDIKLRGSPCKHTESILSAPGDIKLEEWSESKRLPYVSRSEAEAAKGQGTYDASASVGPEMESEPGSRRCHVRGRGRVGILTTNHFSLDGKRVVYGGAERYGVELTKLLLDMGFEVEWWQAGSGWERELLPGVVVHSIPEGNAQFQTAPRLNHTFHERAVGTDYAIYFVPFLAYPQALEKSISVSHGIYWDYPTYESTLGGSAEREEWLRRLFMAIGAVRKLVSVDTATIHWINATCPGHSHKLEYVPNFVDIGEYENLPKPHPHGRIRIIFPRRLTSVRGVNEAAKAAETLTSRYDNVEFHFVGRAHDDVQEKYMIRWAASNERIFYYWRPPSGMPWTYKNMDIAIIPSKATEGTSLSCLEAMAAGCAVVAGYTGGLSDLIIDRYNGRLIKPTFQNLVDALEELISDESLRRRLGGNARETAAAFSLPMWRERWSKVIQEVFN